MDFDRKIIKISLDGLGDAYIQKPSIATRIRMAEILNDPDRIQAVKNILVGAEVLADCLIDETGKRIYKNPEEVLNRIDPDLGDALTPKIIELVTRTQAEKNSQSAPISSSPLASPEN